MVEVEYLPTTERDLKDVLELMDLGPKDTLFDLGSGDGRVVIGAVKHFKCWGVGVEIDPDLVSRAEKKAERNRVDDRVEFRNEDFSLSSIRGATAAFLYLHPSVNVKLVPILNQMHGIKVYSVFPFHGKVGAIQYSAAPSKRFTVRRNGITYDDALFLYKTPIRLQPIYRSLV